MSPLTFVKYIGYYWKISNFSGLLQQIGEIMHRQLCPDWGLVKRLIAEITGIM